MTEIQKPDTAEPIEGEEDLIQVGQWYWVASKKEDPWLACVTHLGSNYVEVTAHTGYHSRRILFENFDKVCTQELDPDKVIGSNIQRCQTNVAQLMGRVREVTARLSVSHSPELASGGHTNALARLDPGVDYDTYKTDLIKAKNDLLPALFKEIAEANKELSAWMTAQAVPLEAMTRSLTGTLTVIKDRIFSVELYAGLVEQVVQVRDGEAASLADKVHLMQRRCYMDEECLARYEAGGMDYSEIELFDAWLARPSNLERLLPHPRCIVAFQVRHYEKVRSSSGGDFRRFLQIMQESENDRKTYLYIRNGDQLFRLTTGVEFEEKLFPDMEQAIYSGKLWGTQFVEEIREIITDREYQGRMEEHQAEVAAWKAKKKAKKKGETLVGWEPRLSERFIPFDKSSVYYDDIKAKIDAELQSHNRIALIIQGLLDRSPVLHPHPPWQIGTPEGFQQALTLVYDTSRALTSGEAPDFEAYRRRLNMALKEGSITVGQQEAWLKEETRKEHERLDQSWRSGNYRPDSFQPWGNPGPGRVARVAKFAPKARRCVYRWMRERMNQNRFGPKGPIPVSYSVGANLLLNISAYTPGDFRQFFEDPRTREDYLKWAPLLLTAEDYHAGAIKVQDDDQEDQ